MLLNISHEAFFHNVLNDFQPLIIFEKMDHHDLNTPLLAFDEYLGTGSGIGKQY